MSEWRPVLVRESRGEFWMNESYTVTVRSQMGECGPRIPSPDEPLDFPRNRDAERYVAYILSQPLKHPPEHYQFSKRRVAEFAAMFLDSPASPCSSTHAK